MPKGLPKGPPKGTLPKGTPPKGVPKVGFGIISAHFRQPPCQSVVIPKVHKNDFHTPKEPSYKF